MILKIREDVSIKFREEDIEFYGKKKFKIKNLAHKLENFVLDLDAGINKSRPLDFLERSLIDRLQEREVLISFVHTENRNQLWESHFKGDFSLEDKSVLIIGCGGTGAIIADHLARGGLGQIGLIDGATLDLPDLNRQFIFSKRDLGRPKVDLLKNHIEEETNCRVIEQHNSYLTSKNCKLIYEEYDLIINCADYPQYDIYKIVINLSKTKKSPILFGSVGITDYIVGPLCITINEKDDYLKKVEESKLFFSKNKKVIKGSHALLNTIAAVEIATKAYKYLTKIQDFSFQKIEL